MAEVSLKSFIPESFPLSTADITGQIGLLWELIKVPFVVPLLRVAVYMGLVMSMIVSAERLSMLIVVLFVKLFMKKPENRYKWEPLQEDVEIGDSAFPMVLVQIPMYNEKEVYKISIGAACNLSWPADRLLIQVLDDSSDPDIKDMIEKECIRRENKGVNIRYQTRETRRGYKAGNLKEGMKHDYIKECEYVAIFDADFRPEPDFLRRSIPFLMHNPELALAQARWKFVNSDECLSTRMQEMSLDYHFTVEQEVGSSTHAFFGFNGTGGVWRIAAINEAGGWKDRTTVEDMDLAVRASLKGWKFLYLGDLQKVSLWKKVYVIYNFFFVRRIMVHMFNFFFYNVIFPLTVFVPEVDVPKWGTIYIPFILTTLSSFGTPRSFHLLFYWILFENVMAFHRTKATIIGLLEGKRANEWVVTKKLGDAFKNKSNTESEAQGESPAKRVRFKLGDGILLHELELAMFLYVCGFYDFLYGRNNYFIYMFLQAIAFTIVGFGYVGTIIPM
ncbi:glucomannan 4-beta-mannosyltransferase 2-like isoform X2 [Olea europaea var. sylvestris]|uniref:glucomannan 4-beta-mannosyltransferase 2-like isoform X2 n=1 Tax=Olea europaea var. sylvestris TaxID=158386 RepID=UPI000C1D7477|nr:glucomannan 4-beta-mannosyltransferase 2-like isoform X2 [Olea europaea var. sylvestris]